MRISWTTALALAALVTFTLLFAFELDKDRQLRPAGGPLTQPPAAGADELRRDESAPASRPERQDSALANSRLRDALANPELRAAVGSVAHAVRVEVLHSLSDDEIEGAIARHGGWVEGAVPGALVQALVPWEQLEPLEAEPGVDYLRPPVIAGGRADERQWEPLTSQGFEMIGEEIAKTNADEWHTAGYSGDGVRIGIFDAFGGNVWTAAQSVGEVPAPSGTFCRFAGQPCNLFDIWGPAEPHGIAVAEIVHEMAPNAELFLATARTTADYQAGVDYFASQGVDIISRSQTTEYDGPGDGTGPFDMVIDNAIQDGITWLNAAGNAGGGPTYQGSYWRGVWSDPDGDDWLNFTPDDELMGIGCGFINGLRWSDWTSGAPTDYDIYVYDEPNDQNPKFLSEDDQGSGAPPVERLADVAYCDGAFDVDYVAIALWEAHGGTAGDILEFATNSTGVEYPQNPYSASVPGCDPFNPGLVCIGAIDPAKGTAIADYSSHGPTNDERIKPDLSAAACVKSFAFFPNCFSGTSAATPAVAGAAALVLESGILTRSGSSVPAALAAYLMNATVERGVAGADNVYGEGELVLPAPPSGPPPALKGDLDCDDDIDSVDALRGLRHVAGLANNLPQGCEPLGRVAGAGGPKGDMDCDGDVDSVDSLRVLRHVAGLGNNLPQGCPALGEFARRRA